MDVADFEAADAGTRSMLLRLSGPGRPQRSGSTLIVQSPAGARQIAALPGSEVVQGGHWRAAFPIDRAVFDAASRYTLVTGDGVPLSPGQPRTRRTAPGPARRPARAPDDRARRLERQLVQIRRENERLAGALEAEQAERAATESDLGERVAALRALEERMAQAEASREALDRKVAALQLSAAEEAAAREALLTDLDEDPVQF